MFKQRGEGLLDVPYNETYDDCGVYTTAAVHHRLSNGWRESSSGVSLPGFYRLKEAAHKQGSLLPQTPWAQTYLSASGYEDWSLRSVSVPCRRYEAHMTGVQSLAIPDLPTLAVPPDNRELLAQQAMAALYKEGWDAGTFLAQFNMAVETVENLVKRLLKLFKTGKLSTADLSNPISEMAWAWRPMLYDIEDLSKLIETLGDDRTGKAWRKSQGATETHSESRVQTVNVAGWYYLTVTETWDLIYSERVKVHSMIAPPRVVFDPLVTSWELVPFSFVLDKLIDIGAYLASLSARIWHQDLQLAYGTQHTLYYSLRKEFSGPGIFTGSFDLSYTYAQVQTNRQPFDALSWMPKLTATPLKASNLIYWVELIRKMRRN